MPRIRLAVHGEIDACGPSPPPQPDYLLGIAGRAIYSAIHSRDGSPRVGTESPFPTVIDHDDTPPGPVPTGPTSTSSAVPGLIFRSRGGTPESVWPTRGPARRYSHSQDTGRSPREGGRMTSIHSTAGASLPHVKHRNWDSSLVSTAIALVRPGSPTRSLRFPSCRHILRHRRVVDGIRQWLPRGRLRTVVPSR